MNRKSYFICLLSILLWGAGVIPAAAQMPERKAVFTYTMEMGSKAGMQSRDNRLASYYMMLTPGVELYGKWSLGLLLEGSFLANHASASIVSYDYKVGYTAAYLAKDFDLGIQQAFGVYSSATGRFDSEVAVRVYYPGHKNAYIRVAGGYSQPYQTDVKGFFYLSAGFGIKLSL